MKKLRHWLAHYFFGLGTSCWNAGIAAIKINGGVAVASAAAPSLVHAADLRAMLAIFGAAIFWEAIDYFNDHKLPAALPDDDVAKPAAPASPGSLLPHS